MIINIGNSQIHIVRTTWNTYTISTTGSPLSSELTFSLYDANDITDLDNWRDSEHTSFDADSLPMVLEYSSDICVIVRITLDDSEWLAVILQDYNINICRIEFAKLFLCNCDINCTHDLSMYYKYVGFQTLITILHGLFVRYFDVTNNTVNVLNTLTTSQITDLTTIGKLLSKARIYCINCNIELS
jgi:hypothetical protein